MTYKKAVSLFLVINLILIGGGIFVRIALQNYVCDVDRATWITKAKMIDQLDDTYHGDIILGTSKALALNPQYLNQKYGIDIINLSAGGANPPTIYFFLKRLLNNNVKPHKIYIEISPENLKNDTDINNALGERYLRFLANYNEAVELDEYYPVSLQKYKRMHTFPYPDYFCKKWSTLLLGSYKRFSTGFSDSKIYNALESNGGFYIFGKETIDFSSIDISTDEKHIKDFEKNYDMNDVPYISVSEIYLDKIITLLEENHIDYSFFFSPFPKSRDPQKIFGRSESFYQKISPNRIDKQLLFLDDEYFVDQAHLNYKGSILYNEYFSHRFYE